jgi:hypothetical protein
MTSRQKYEIFVGLKSHTTPYLWSVDTWVPDKVVWLVSESSTGQSLGPVQVREMLFFKNR